MRVEPTWSELRGAGVVLALLAALSLGRSGAARGPSEDAPNAASTSSGPRVVDLNRATAAELEALPGIGPALAGRIVEARRDGGPFQTVEALERVPGIGAVTLARIHPWLRVSGQGQRSNTHSARSAAVK